MTGRRERGRSGRLYLRQQLARSERAGDLLHQKEEVLRRERTRLEGYASRTKAVWEDACTELDRSVARVRVLGGAGELREIAATAHGAVVTCRWQSQMGVDYPDMASAQTGSVRHVTGTAAFGPAIAACETALIAAAEHAAAELALDRIEQATAETRRRRRAVVKRLVPRLRDQLQRVEVDLDEAEREEATRIRLAVDRIGGRS